MNKRIAVLALAVALLGAVPVYAADKEKAAAPAAKQPAASKEATFDPKKLPTVLATVGKAEIKKDLFVRVMQNLVKQMKGSGQPVTAEWLKDVQGKVLDRMVMAEVLFQDAQANGIKIADKDVEEQFDRMLKSFPSKDEYMKALKEQGTSEKELKADIRKNLQIRKLLEDKAASLVKVDQKDVRKYYDDHAKEFERPETVRARHIILMLDPKADEAKKAEVRKKMEDIQAKLKGGATFEELAKQYSQDGSAQNGGDLGFFPKEAMVKEFSDVVWNMKPGEVSGIVSSQFGLHLIKFEERKAAGAIPFDEVKEDLVRGLERERKGEAVNKYIADVRAKAKVKTNI